MHNKQENQHGSSVLLALEVDTSLYQGLVPDAQLYRTLQQALTGALSEVMNKMGVPGNLEVQLIAFEKKSVASSQFLRVRVNGQLCRYPDELLRYVHSYVNSSHLDPRATMDNLLAWLNTLAKDEASDANLHRENLVEFLTLACTEIIKRQPEVLLGPDQIIEYVTSLPKPLNTVDQQLENWPPDVTSLQPILKTVLHLKISLADKESVAKVLGKIQTRSQEEIAEDLIDTLRQEVIEIQLPVDYLRQITIFDQVNGPAMFPFLRTGLFQELGVRYPLFHFVSVDNLKPNSFAFKIHHLTTLPMIGLRADQCLVNSTQMMLRLENIEGQPITNPANDIEESLIALSSQDKAVSAGLTKWNQIEYVILSLAASLRANSRCFIHKAFVQDQLEQLSLMFPALATAVKSRTSWVQLTRILRALIAEEIAIRNLRLIFERLVEYNFSAVGPATGNTLDNPPVTFQAGNTTLRTGFTDVLTFIRTGLQNQMKQKYSRGTNTILVYLLDPEIEGMLSKYRDLEPNELSNPGLDEEEQEKILHAIRHELTYLPPTAQVPAILTTDDVRYLLLKTIADEIPRMPVLCYTDLPPSINIQPVARIALST